MISTALALLCLASVSHSTPLTCTDLTRPVDQLDPRRLEGRWALVSGSISHLPFLEIFKQRDSATVTFSSITHPTRLSYSRSLRVNGSCSYSSYNISLQGSSFVYEGAGGGNDSGAYFVHTTCADCMMFLVQVESGTRQHFYFFSRRRRLEESEMEEFRAQVGCLNMPPPAVMDPTKELCPEETAGDPEDQTAAQ